MSDDEESKNYKIREFKKEDFDAVMQLLKSNESINPYTFFTTDYFIRSRFSKCFVCEDTKNNEVIGTTFGIAKSKKRTNSNDSVLKFHIYMIYVKNTSENISDIYEELIREMIYSVENITIDSKKVSEINATIPHTQYYDQYLLDNLKKHDFFKYELIIRYYEDGSSALRMKKILIFPSELEF